MGVVLSEGPRVDLTGSGVIALAGLGLVGLAAWWVYANREKLASAAESALAKVNPADDRNAAYGAVSSVGEAITGRQGWTLGSQIADWFPSAAERELTRQMSGAAPAPSIPEPEPYGVAPYYAP